MSTITTHVLDIALGRPAAGVSVSLERVDASGGATALSTRWTDDDGRVRDLVAAGDSLAAGRYRLRFDTGAWFAAAKRDCFYPSVTVDFTVADDGGHYHVPLLLSSFGYSTYRGS